MFLICQKPPAKKNVVTGGPQMFIISVCLWMGAGTFLSRNQGPIYMERG